MRRLQRYVTDSDEFQRLFWTEIDEETGGDSKKTTGAVLSALVLMLTALQQKSKKQDDKGVMKAWSILEYAAYKNTHSDGPAPY